MNDKHKPDLRDKSGHGTVNSDTEKHVAGAGQKLTPDDPFHLVRPEPGKNVPPGQATKM